MKRYIGIIMLVALLAGVHVVNAEEMKEGMKGKCMKCEMMGKEMMGKEMMGKGMMGRSVVATSDGGVVIVMHNKMAKYDRNLNLVKEVELKMDMDGIRQKLQRSK